MFFGIAFCIGQLRQLLLNYVLVSEKILNKESQWRDLISLLMYKYKFLQAGQLPREHVFLAKSAEFFYHKIFETSR